jgi:hypothetical protein
MTRPLEPDAEFYARCERLDLALAKVLDDMVSCALAEAIGEDNQGWADRIYAGLEARPIQDLSLMIVLALRRQSDERLRRELTELRSEVGPL